MSEIFAYKTFVRHEGSLYSISDVGLQCMDHQPYQRGVWLTAPVGPFFGQLTEGTYISTCNPICLKVEIQDLAVASSIHFIGAFSFRFQEELALAIKSKRTFLKRDALQYLTSSSSYTYTPPADDNNILFYKMKIPQ